MINNNIPGLNQNAIQFVYRNLMIDMSEDDSSNAFRKYVFSNCNLDCICNQDLDFISLLLKAYSREFE